jgi:hypothetical protein
LPAHPIVIPYECWSVRKVAYVRLPGAFSVENCRAWPHEPEITDGADPAEYVGVPAATTSSGSPDASHIGTIATDDGPSRSPGMKIGVEGLAG